MESQQGSLVLRPLEIKHLFDFMIRIYRSNFAAMFLSQAIVEIPLTVLGLYVSLKSLGLIDQLAQFDATGRTPGWEMFTENEGTLLTLGIAALFAMAYQLLVMPLGNLACSRLATMAVFGKRISLLEALAFARSRYWQTQVALATFFLPLVILSFLLLLPVLGFQAAGNEAGTIGAAFFALGGIMLGGLGTLLLWYRFFPALFGIIQCNEDAPEQGVFAQGLWYLRRAYELSKGYFLRLFGLMLLLALAMYLINNGLSETSRMLVMLVEAIASGDFGKEFMAQAMGEGSMASLAIAMTLASLVGLLFPPLVICYMSLLYFDLRCRKEAYDIKLVLGIDQPTS